MDTGPNDDAQLLREFAADQSQSAFRTLVERYRDMVYGTARRRLGNDEAALDVSQNVFSALARKAPWLCTRASVGGWLYKSTLMEAARRQRDDLRRMKRERRYAEEMNIRGTNDEDEDAPPLKELMPVLDDAMSGLSSADREALLLRFFRGLSLRDTGAAMGTTEEAARKRVSRAMEKLSTLFKRKGITMPALAIGTLLLPKASSMAAPAALTAKATAAAAALPAPSVAALVYMKAAALSKPAVAALCLTAAAVPATWQAVRIHRLTEENQQLALTLSAPSRVTVQKAAPVPQTVISVGETKSAPTGDAGVSTFDKHSRRGKDWSDLREKERRLDREGRLTALASRLWLNEHQFAVIADAMEKADSERDALWQSAWGAGKTSPDKAAQDAITAAREATIAAVITDEQRAAYADFIAEEEQTRQGIYANQLLSEMQRGGLHLTDAQSDQLWDIFVARAAESGGDAGPGTWSQLFQEGQVQKLHAVLTVDQFRLWQQRIETKNQFFRPDKLPGSTAPKP